MAEGDDDDVDYGGCGSAHHCAAADAAAAAAVVGAAAGIAGVGAVDGGPFGGLRWSRLGFWPWRTFA